jgi:hypothetical protein
VRAGRCPRRPEVSRRRPGPWRPRTGRRAGRRPGRSVRRCR